MNTLIIYDENGNVITTRSGDMSLIKEPIGIPFLWVDIPDGKRLKSTDSIGVDVSVTPHQAILEDIPPTEIEVLKEDTSAVAEMTATVAEDNASIADTLANVLLEIENLKAEVTALKGA